MHTLIRIKYSTFYNIYMYKYIKVYQSNVNFFSSRESSGRIRAVFLSLLFYFLLFLVAEKKKHWSTYITERIHDVLRIFYDAKPRILTLRSVRKLLWSKSECDPDYKERAKKARRGN